MPALPPFELLVDAALYAVFVPAVVAAAASWAALRFMRGGRTTAAGAWGVAIGFLAGNCFRHAVEFRIAFDRPFSIVESFVAAWYTVTGFGLPAHIVLPPARFWLPWASAFVAVAGMLAQSPRLPAVARRLIAIGTVVIAGRLIVTPAMRAEFPWLWVAMALAILANWQVLEAVSRDLTSGSLPGGLTALFLLAAAVLIQAHTARFTDVATMLAGAWLGVAVVSFVANGIPGGAQGIAATALPGLMLIAQDTTFSAVPLVAFVLIGLAPLALTPLLMVPVQRRSGGKFATAAWALLLTPACAALLLAVSAE